MQRRRVGRRRERLAEPLLGEHLGELGEELQVLLGRVLRNEQHEDVADRAAVGRVERDRRLEAREGAARLGETLDSAVRYRDPLAEAGRAQLLARLQAAHDLRAVESVAVLEQAAERGEQIAFRPRVEIGQDVRRGQEVCDRVHRSGSRRRPRRRARKLGRTEGVRRVRLRDHTPRG